MALQFDVNSLVSDLIVASAFGIYIEHVLDYGDEAREDVETDNIGEISTTYPPTNHTSNNPEKAVANWASIVENENPQAELKS
ncbi:hypothetical protein PCASD_10386 [Puccinia coronata f. sp. avenae]|uniref:Uncharacterized protein n=1 Tax=Puccinia coronata f. sp. avenae TaxID=200324 RepID=A0A2N5SIA2_9BASI|nr:hypothetical protein PCASD_20978 [Puccinia coronata f. sp. avenae]PLW40443.1 hypothetical protein PCASD_10386 [Puccinia coronata f. sp. avenae]